MDTLDRIERGLTMMKSGQLDDLMRYIRCLKLEDLLAAELLEVRLAVYNHNSSAIRKGTRLISRVSGKPRLASFLFNCLGTAYELIGELDAADGYFVRAEDMAGQAGDLTLASIARLRLLTNRFFRAEYEPLYNEARGFLARVRSPEITGGAKYLVAALEIIRGNPEKALKLLDSIISEGGSIVLLGATEMKGLASRMMGKLQEARDLYVESMNIAIEFGSAYATFPCAKALELTRLAGLEPPPKKLVRRCLALARRGSSGEKAGAQEIEALLCEDPKRSTELLFDAALGYYRVNQNIEVILTGLTAALFAWQDDHPVFPKILKLLAPLLPLHPGFRRDPLLGEFMISVEPLLRYGKGERTVQGVRASLLGEFMLQVDGEEVSLRAWRNSRALMALLYLLLSPKHRISQDHLAYLLWPRRRYDARTRKWLYTAIYTIRRNLGKPQLLTKRGDFYQLEDVWTDLGEIENLMRLADATRDPAEKEELLARARELAKGELLPEFPYDSHIDEYRQYYNRLRKRLFGDNQT
ncbi:MAG: hypothetical protein ABIM74_04225 [candidate division WOR-3 bacterium]